MDIPCKRIKHLSGCPFDILFVWVISRESTLLKVMTHIPLWGPDLLKLSCEILYLHKTINNCAKRPRSSFMATCYIPCIANVLLPLHVKWWIVLINKLLSTIWNIMPNYIYIFKCWQVWCLESSDLLFCTNASRVTIPKSSLFILYSVGREIIDINSFSSKSTLTPSTMIFLA